MSNVLVAGGAGYIGSHTVKALQSAGHSPVIYDNAGRGHRTVADILGCPAVFADLDDTDALTTALREHSIDTVMHFAAFAYVGESVHEPLMYYHNNVATTVNVLEAMREVGVNRFVFSSTCAVYGDPDEVPITEDEKKAPVSPYGRSKWHVEEILADLAASDEKFKYAALRYFNASGCDPEGRLGEDHDPETHLIPVVLRGGWPILGTWDKVSSCVFGYPQNTRG
ncbi:MAG: NAD-dependent epimerase/dehydratase family protein [Planctomycetota bacterium]